MPGEMEFTLNGRPVSVEGVSPNITLLDFLRRRGLTGTKEGCAEGDCGACSVVLIESNSNGKPSYRSVNSCLLPICVLTGREVITVEGIGASATPHPVQRKIAEGHGSQCGYCTPGFICSLFEAYYREDLRTSAQLDEQLAGNLCRCTGYGPIRHAAIEALREHLKLNGRDPFAERLKSGNATISGTSYSVGAENFFRPRTLAELFRVLEANPNAVLIAGGTELGVDIAKRFEKFPTLISLEALSEMKQIECTNSVWRIGATVTLTEVEERVAPEFPALGDMLRVFGSRQIRNRATIAGNLVTASPIGDCAPVLLALDAEVVLTSAAGERCLPVVEFFVSYRRTALRPGEVLKEILIPRGVSEPGLTRKMAWFKVSKRRELDISTVAACFVLDLNRQGVIHHARLAYAGVAPVPTRAKNSEARLLGNPWGDATVQKVLPVLQAEFTPISDVRGSARFRAALVTSLFEKFYSDSTEVDPEKAEPGTHQLQSGGGQSHGLLPERQATPHESGHKHVTGEAIYTDDFAARRNMLEVWPVCAPYARARILRRDVAAAKSMPGVAAVLLAEDVPGLNDVGAVRRDEILLADKEVYYYGQIVALVVGENQEACRAAAARVLVEYEPLIPILTIEEAIAQNSFHTEPNFIRRGDVQAALATAPHTLRGEFFIPGQEHFYLEMQAAWAEPGEDGAMFVMASTQYPSEAQQVIARLLGVAANLVVVQSPRLGGGFGGKETQAATFAGLAALAAARTRRLVRVRINRDLDMMLTGKRHPFLAKFEVGYNEQGDLLAARIQLISNGGWSLDLSLPVTDRAVFHLDNAYYVPKVEFSGQVAKTNLASNTAFRGFGGPQGMLVIEEIIDRIARRLNRRPEEFRERNLYRGRGETNTTHYGQEIEDNRLQRVWRELKASSSLEKRRAEIARWNSKHSGRKRGLAMTPVKFGISFTLTHLNQAGALVLIYQDGTVQVNHGGTEMGQGVHTNIALIAARELGIPLASVRVMPTSTDKVPNTSATAASCGTDLNGMAVKNACATLRGRLAPIALESLGHKPPIAAASLPHGQLTEGVVFANCGIFHCDRPEAKVPFVEVVKRAYLARISLSATGFYRTPEIHYDRAKGKGRPFLYFAVGASVSEVEVDGFTGMMRILRTDILHDVGDSINAGVNLGQIEGGFVQGAGWLTCEELIWNNEGVLLTHSPDTYKIPAVSDRPLEFNVSFLSAATQRNTIHGSKAVGEPPLMLAISVREAIRDAVAAFGPGAGEIELATPATCEAIWMAIQKQRDRSSKQIPGREFAGAK